MRLTGLFVLATIVYCVDAVSPKKGTADLTHYTSYPARGSKEWKDYNGGLWEGQFAFVDGKKPESWVESNRIIAIHEKHASKYRLKTFKITQGARSITAKVYDKCSDSDCNGCCTKNSKKTGFLIDMEKYTLRAFGGSGSGVVQWECLDC
ncbi:hypothetical protein HDE_11916 [Halotydeus destructor]|nr:hypothetical protein HDE_11916 [Halotydeus destructor]